MIYYIACTTTERLKIGYTQSEPEVRLKQLQTGSAADLRLVACHEGDLDDERLLHAKFASQRVRGEWFAMSEDLLEHLCWIIWLAGARCSASGEPAPFWVCCGLRMIKDDSHAELPEYLEALL